MHAVYFLEVLFYSRTRCSFGKNGLLGFLTVSYVYSGYIWLIAILLRQHIFEDISFVCMAIEYTG